MTTHFDRAASRLGELGRRMTVGEDVTALLRAEEEALVRDAVVAALLLPPPYGPTFATVVHRAVLRSSVATREPSLPPVSAAPDLWLGRVHNLQGDLHGCFHALAREAREDDRPELLGVTDDPLSVTGRLADDASDERVALYRADPSAAEPNPPRPPAAGPYYAALEARLDALAAHRAAGRSVWEDLRALEEEVVRDASVAVVAGALAPAHRVAVHRAVLGGSVTTREGEVPEADFGDDAEWVERMRQMVRAVAEALAGAGLDSPLAPLDALAARASEQRLALYRADPSAAEPNPPRPPAAGPYYAALEARLDALAAHRAAGRSVWEDLRALEEEVVRDASVAVVAGALAPAHAEERGDCEACLAALKARQPKGAWWPCDGCKGTGEIGVEGAALSVECPTCGGDCQVWRDAT